MDAKHDCGARVRHVTGRLIEVEFRESEVHVARAAQFLDEFRKAQDSAARSGCKTVVFVDCRGLTNVGRSLSALMSSTIRLSNTTLERSGVLMSQGPVFALEMARIAREGNDSKRRHFDDKDDAVDWLGERLDADERARLRALATLTTAI